MAGTCGKVALVVSTVWLSLACSGIIYGWLAFVTILEDVHPDWSSTKLDRIFAIAAALTAASGMFVGAVLDSIGPRMTCMLSGCMSIGGSILVGFEISLLAGYCLWAVAGLGVLISGFRVGFVMPNHMSLIIGLVSCLFDSSTAVFLAFKYLYFTHGFTLKWICLGYAALTAVSHLLNFVFWSMNSDYDGNKAYQPPPRALSNVYSRSASIYSRSVSRQSGRALTNRLLHSLSEGGGAADAPVKVMDRPLKQQLRSVEFWFIYLFCVICMFRSNLFLGTMHFFVSTFPQTGAANAREFDTLVSAAVPLGFLFVPVITCLINRGGKAWTAHATVFLGAAYGVCTLVNSLEMQVVAAIIFACYRALLFTYVADYCASTFGPGSVGRVTGIIYTTMAVFVVLQYPITSWVDESHDRWWTVHFIATVALAPVFLFTVYAQIRSPELRGDAETHDELSMVRTFSNDVTLGGFVGHDKLPLLQEVSRTSLSV